MLCFFPIATINGMTATIAYWTPNHKSVGIHITRAVGDLMILASTRSTREGSFRDDSSIDLLLSPGLVSDFELWSSFLGGCTPRAVALGLPRAGTPARRDRVLYS